MNINDVVAHALKVRNDAEWHTKYALDCNVEDNHVILTCYPFNGSYVEHATGAYKFYIQDGKIKSTWIGAL